MKAGRITLFIMLILIGIVASVVGLWELFESRSILQSLEILGIIIGGIGLIIYSTLTLAVGNE